MKRQIIVIFILLINAVCEGQEKVNLICSYQLEYSKNKLDIEDKSYALMTLEIGEKMSRFCSLDAYRKDSLLFWDSQALSGTEIFANLNKYKTKDPEYVIMKQRKQITFLNHIVNEYYRYEENPVFSWEYTSETDTILNYPCMKAIGKFAGREYIAWFTSSIPISDGPWKFFGTPGLILSISDTKGEYRFDCVGIKKNKNTRRVIRDYDRDFIDCKKEEYLKIEKDFKNDAIKFISNSYGATITSSKTSKKRSKYEYNPIELE